MACPYFYPVARFENNPWTVPPRLPLGDAFSGECRAPGQTTPPDESRLRDVCNMGLGRHGCEQFPTDASSHAIRFHVAKDAGELIQIQYVFEKNCWPGERGSFDWPTHPDFSPNEILRRQAAAFVQSYLRRRNQA
jgi:hypothetical protein